MTNTNARPVHEIRLGKIVASIWANATPKGVMYTVTVSRLYRTQNSWRKSFNYGRDDLPVVAKVMNEAHTWLFSGAPKPTQPAANGVPTRNVAQPLAKPSDLSQGEEYEIEQAMLDDVHL